MAYPSKYPQLKDRTWLVEQYVDRRRSSIEIAEELGCGPSLVQTRLRENGIRMRGRHSGKWKPKTCERCSVDFIPSGPAARFCSAACRAGTAVCESCGKTFVKRQTRGPKSAKDNLYCTYTCRWAAARSRDDYGRYLNSEGYVILDKRWSARPASKGVNANGYVRLNLRKDGRVLEHRYVMEQNLGRELLSDETVHHKNGVKTDNRPENLELWVSKHPRGQRVDDIVEWAVEMLRRYAPDQLG
jgi:hypothetical protein